jgi:hypothetical protein
VSTTSLINLIPQIIWSNLIDVIIQKPTSSTASKEFVFTRLSAKRNSTIYIGTPEELQIAK